MTEAASPLRPPFPAFGGKARIAPALVDRLRFEEMGGHDGDSDGDPTWSRVFGPRSLVLRITGPDRRRGALA